MLSHGFDFQKYRVIDGFKCFIYNRRAGGRRTATEKIALFAVDPILWQPRAVQFKAKTCIASTGSFQVLPVLCKFHRMVLISHK